MNKDIKTTYQIHVYPWLIHVYVWQKPLQYCKIISLQLIKRKEKQKQKQTNKKTHTKPKALTISNNFIKYIYNPLFFLFFLWLPPMRVVVEVV